MEQSIFTIVEKTIAHNENMTHKQKAILEAAIHLFSEQGFAATSTSQIAKRAGVAEGTIFKYYTTKEKLLYSTILPLLVEDVFPQALADLKEGVFRRSHPDLESFIHAFVDNRFAFAKQNAPMIKIFVSEILYRTELKHRLLTLFTSQGVHVFGELLRHLKQEKVLVDWPDTVIIRTLISNLVGYCFPRFFLFPELEWDDEKELSYVKQSILKTLTP